MVGTVRPVTTVRGRIPLQRILLQLVNVSSVTRDIGDIGPYLLVGVIQLRTVNSIATGGRDVTRRYVGHLFITSINATSRDAWPTGHGQPIRCQHAGISAIGSDHGVNHRVIRHLQLHDPVSIHYGFQVLARIGACRGACPLDPKRIAQFLANRSGVSSESHRGISHCTQLSYVNRVTSRSTRCYTVNLTELLIISIANRNRSQGAGCRVYRCSLGSTRSSWYIPGNTRRLAGFGTAA
ncbi:hypothetical protein D3C73_467090 [compost metagenome]